MIIGNIVSAQRQFFNSGATRSIAFRQEQLMRLENLFKAHLSEIYEALWLDLHKSKTEAYVTETSLILKELKLAINQLSSWAKPQTVTTPLLLFPGNSKVYFEPYGVSLIISTWNFPFLLTLQPLIGAIAAGNCVLIKPSEIASHAEKIITTLINENFNQDFLHVINGDAETTKTLLKEKFDYIFFTGSERVGKSVMHAAADYVTPLTLELGGKNPCIVDESADVTHAAKHIMWAKTLNAGQVCVAPDYLFVHHSVKDQLVLRMREMLQQFYGDNIKQSHDFGRIINEKHFLRLTTLLKSGNILFGGNFDEQERYVEPTVIDKVSWDDPIMQEEIFGPLLPIFTFDNIEDVITQIQQQPKSLSLYLFANNKTAQERVVETLSFGNGAINTCILQMANFNLPFGGVGESGMGSYHGKSSFETFSHRKSVYKKMPIIDVTLHHPPYSDKKHQWVERVVSFCNI